MNKKLIIHLVTGERIEVDIKDLYGHELYPSLKMPINLMANANDNQFASIAVQIATAGYFSKWGKKEVEYYHPGQIAKVTILFA